MMYACVCVWQSVMDFNHYQTTLEIAVKDIHLATHFSNIINTISKSFIKYTSNPDANTIGNYN